MDPITALGVAGNVIQIVDFSLRFLLSVKRVCTSEDGEIEEIKNLRNDADKLRQLNSHFTTALKTRELSSAPTNWEKDALSICQECEATSAELSKLLKGLAVDGQSYGRPLAATLLAMKAIWKKNRMAKLQSRLESLRGMLVSTIVMDIQ